MSTDDTITFLDHSFHLYVALRPSSKVRGLLYLQPTPRVSESSESSFSLTLIFLYIFTCTPFSAMLALKKKREAEAKAAAEAAAGASTAQEPEAGDKVSLLGIGGKKKTKSGDNGGFKKRRYFMNISCFSANVSS